VAGPRWADLDGTADWAHSGSLDVPVDGTMLEAMVADSATLALDVGLAGAAAHSPQPNVTISKSLRVPAASIVVLQVTPPPCSPRQAVAEFWAKVCKPLPSAVARNPVPHRRSKMPTTVDGLPWRSEHVTAQGRNRVANLVKQAQSVMCQRWVITSGRCSPDAEAIKAYDAIFCSPLGLVQCRASGPCS
jgi:hypothetical protein